MTWAIVIASGVGLASAGAGIASQANAADQQNSYRNRLGITGNRKFKENADAIISDIGLQIDQLGQREIQQQAAIRQELSGFARNARETSGTYAARSGALGVQGSSVDAVHQQFARDVLDFEATSRRQMQDYRAQAAFEAQGIYSRGQSAINQGYPNPLPPVATVSPATSIMNGVSTGFAVYSSLGSFKTPSGVGSSANPSLTPPPLLATPNVPPPYLAS